VPLSLPIAKGKTNFKMFINCLWWYLWPWAPYITAGF
jgi:hypothetical protein